MGEPAPQSEPAYRNHKAVVMLANYVSCVSTGRSGGCFAAPSQHRNGVGYPGEALGQRRDYEEEFDRIKRYVTDQ